MFFGKHRFSEMFHVKHILFIIIVFLNLFVNNIKSFASTNILSMDYVMSYYQNVFYILDDSENPLLLVCQTMYDISSPYYTEPSIVYNNNGTVTIHLLRADWVQYNIYYNPSNVVDSGNITYTRTDRISSEYFTTNGNKAILLKGHLNGDIVKDFYYKPWYTMIWDVFKGGFETGTTWIQTQVDNIGTIVQNWWYDITHGSHGGSHSFGNKYLTVNQATPTPIPTITPRPTPIPYSTVLQDDGNGNTTIMYHYNNLQGTPTASPYNPNQYIYYNNDININGGDRNNPIYVQDVGNVNFSDLIDIANNSIQVNIGDLDESTDMFTVPLEETAENVGEAISGFSALPDDLFIIIGCIACIPLIAGIIGRLLK